MPELPDVETFKRYVDATALHQPIETVEVDAARELNGMAPVTLARRLSGQSLERTHRHGKHLFVHVSGDGWLRLHFGMTGRLRYFRDDDKRPDHTRLLLRFDNGYQLAYDCQRRLGSIGLVDDPDAFINDNELGPDALDPALDESGFCKLMADRRGTVKPALMDQAFIAGLGNVYVDEILFRARLHPRAEPRKLDAKTCGRLYRAMHDILDEAIACQADPDRLPGSWLLHHKSPGETCPRCGEPLDKITVSGRSTWFCPGCQKEGA